MKCTRRVLAWVAFVAATGPLVALAQFQQGQGQPPPQQGQPQQGQPQQGQPQRGQPPQQAEVKVIATVNGDPITSGEVTASLQPQLQGRKVDPQTAQQLQKQVVDNLVETRLVEQYVLEKGPEVEQQEVKAVVDRFKEQLAAQQLSLDDYVVSRGHTPDSFEDRIKASLAWQKFQKEQLTDENLTQYFQEHQQQFNTESFEEARPAVVNAYVGELWKQIVDAMKPKAEIKVAPAEQNRPAPELPNQPPPQQVP